MSSLQAFYAGAFNNVTEVSNLNEVLLAGNTTAQNIVSTGDISCRDFTCADITSTNDIIADNMTASGIVTLRQPLNPSYNTLDYPITAGAVGSFTSVDNSSLLPSGALPVTGVSLDLITSTTVLPLGVYMLACRVSVVNLVNPNVNISVGVVNTSASDTPPFGSAGGFNGAVDETSKGAYINFTSVFISSTGFQSPKFTYGSLIEGTQILFLAWTATKIG